MEKKSMLRETAPTGESEEHALEESSRKPVNQTNPTVGNSLIIKLVDND
jgi:hypothetical protein